jgi:hypothetical protein
MTWAVLAAAVFGAAACSEAPTTAAKTEAASTSVEPPKPTGPVTAKTAFWEMYKPARAWATDQLLLGLANKEVEGVKDEPGKAAMWEGLFVSQSQNQIRAFTYSVVDQPPTILKGIKEGPALAWGGPTTQAMPIQLSDFTVDSDAAYKTAMTKAGPWVEKHPDKTVTYTLGLASRFPTPVWYLLWGTKTNGFAVYVNASTGAIMDVK